MVKTIVKNDPPAAPFNLSDIVTLVEPSQPKDERLYATTKSHFTTRARVEALVKDPHAESLLGYNDLRDMRGYLTAATGKATEAAARYFSTTLNLPEEFEINANLKRMARLPRVDMAELRQVIDILGMVIFPIEYMTEKALAGECYEVRTQIRNYAAIMSDYFQLYVAGPMHYYSTHEHLKAKHDLPIYANPQLSAAFNILNLTMPMLRSLRQDIDKVMDHVNAQTERINQLNTNLADLDRRVLTLQRDTERMQRQQYEAELQRREMQKELDALRASKATEAFYAYEPMIVSIPKDSSIHEVKYALAGPCWGPDFPAIVATVHSLRKKEGQRSLLARSLQPFSG